MTFPPDIFPPQLLDAKCVSADLKSSTITNLQYQDVQFRDNNTISLTLKWTAANDHLDPIDHCNVYSACVIGKLEDEESCWKTDSVYLGRAHASCFRVVGLHILSTELKENPFSFQFRVQPVTCARRKPSVEESPCLVLKVTP